MEADANKKRVGVLMLRRPAPETPPMFDIWDRFNAQARERARAKAVAHEEQIERLRRRRNDCRKSWSLNVQRRAEIEKLILYRHGRGCDTDDAEIYLQAALPHLIRIHAASTKLNAVVATWVRTFVPAVAQAAVDEMVERALVEESSLLQADAIAKFLSVSNAERSFLKLRTIGACDRTKRQRKADRKRRNAEAQRERRARNGATPRAQSKAATQPWKALGISRSTFYEHLKKGRIEVPPHTDRTKSSSIVRSTKPSVTSQSDRYDPAGQGSARKASATPCVGADGPSPGAISKAVLANHSRAVPHPEGGWAEQPDLLENWQSIAAVAEAAIQTYTGGVMPLAVIQAVRVKQKARVLRQEDVAQRIGVSRPHLANALRGRIGLSQQAAARVRDWLAAA